MKHLTTRALAPRKDFKMSDFGGKRINKSIRLTEDAYEFIMFQDGNGFNQKLDNMIFRYEYAEHELNKRLEKARKELKVLTDALESLSALKSHVDRVNKYVEFIDEIIQTDIPKFNLYNTLID